MNTISAVTVKGSQAWVVELASDSAARSKGLMFRHEMPTQSGMLFRFDETRPVAMWMKNTFISLDMVFLDEAGQVTHIHKAAVPESTAIISSQGAVRFVLELNAGQVDLSGLTAGMFMMHPWFSGRE